MKASVQNAGYRFFGKNCTWYPKQVDIQLFYALLTQHDWYSGFSDSSEVYRRGAAERELLNEIGKQSPEHQALLDGFHRHHFSGAPWSTEKHPLPARP